MLLTVLLNYCSFYISSSNAFWRWLFYYFLFLAETFIISVNVLYVVRNEISVGSDKKWEISPVDSHCKNRSLLFFTMVRSYLGKSFVFCRIMLKFRFWEHKKCWRISCKFQFEITSIGKAIAKKRLKSLIYEMNIRILKSCTYMYKDWQKLTQYEIYKKA